MLDASKWPSFTGEPAQRLAELNTAIQAEGWKGIGLWVAAQEAARYKDTSQLASKEILEAAP